MLAFVSRHAGTLIVSLLLLGIVVLIIRHLAKGEKRGHCASCGGCGHKEQCRRKN